MSNLAKKQMQHAGFLLTGDVDSTECGISPLTTYAGEDLEDLDGVKGEEDWRRNLCNLFCGTPKKTVL
eukprot:CAMPEP_0196823374 /NCGR_PEP_ID=MMETSP1362-20130617/87180_1 /TAXON_ID=163516 /ORGANISM="Leptocylindrus danicus, Strain CCMP1856" /LENGTH=67 /DNA_ID=CAMNT_0042203213 /DNA_START=102 /DNA_END=301 /DNA_ORIENTATION=-